MIGNLGSRFVSCDVFEGKTTVGTDIFGGNARSQEGKGGGSEGDHGEIDFERVLEVSVEKIVKDMLLQSDSLKL